jgi:nucleoid-associated protein YgaU
MADWSDMGDGAKAVVGAVVLAMLAGGGYTLWQRAQPSAVVVEVAAPVSEVAANPAVPTVAAAQVANAPAEGAPVVEVAPPVAEASSPEVAAPKVAVPVAQAVAPVAQAVAPVAQAVAPVAQAVAPVAQAVAPVAQADARVAEAVVEPVVPSLDLVRIEPDGTALVAGKAPAGALISLMADAVEVAATTADPMGKFVAMFTLPQSASGQMLSMAVTMPDGTHVNSPGLVAIATINPPVIVAEATPVTPEALVPAQDTTAAMTTTAAASAATTAATTAAPTKTALAVTDAGVKVLQNAAKLASGAVSLDVIAYPSPATVQFGGRGVADQFVRLYLNNAALGEAVPIAKDGSWSKTVDGIAPRIYTLRVDQIDASGKVISRFETPFKRETPAALAAASAVVAQAVPEVVPLTEPLTDPVTGTVAAPETVPALGVAVVASNLGSATPAADLVASPAPSPVTVTVQPGFTLWRIAEQNFGSGVLYVQVFEANRDKIKDPDLIYPGQVFIIPDQN